MAAVGWSAWSGTCDVTAGEGPHAAAVTRTPARVRAPLPELEAPLPEADAPQEDATEGELAGADVDDELDTVWVRGRVVSLGGTLPDGARVLIDAEDNCDAIRPDSDCEHVRRTTNPDPDTGEFELRVPPGRYTIVARGEGQLPAGAHGLVLTSGETVEGLMLTLEPGGHVSGVVYSEGEPQVGVRVIASGEGYVRGGVTNEEGHFDIGGLPRGELSVRAYTGSAGGDEKTVHTGATVSLELARRERVRGRVVDARGFPAEGVTISSDYVEAHFEADSDPWPEDGSDYFGGMEAHGCSDDCYARSVTDASGTFELMTSPGEELVVAGVRGQERAYVEGISFGHGDLELVLKGPVQLKLVDEDGEPTSGFVQVEPPARFWEGGCNAGGDGSLVLPAATSGAQTLIVPKGTHLEGDVPQGSTVAERETLDLVY
jgi:hypothetical protein